MASTLQDKNLFMQTVQEIEFIPNNASRLRLGRSAARFKLSRKPGGDREPCLARSTRLIINKPAGDRSSNQLGWAGVAVKEREGDR